MIVLVAVVIGALLGYAIGGPRPVMAGAALGLLAGLFLRALLRNPASPLQVPTGQLPSDRLDALERRIAELESRLRGIERTTRQEATTADATLGDAGERTQAPEPPAPIASAGTTPSAATTTAASDIVTSASSVEEQAEATAPLSSPAAPAHVTEVPPPRPRYGEARAGAFAPSSTSLSTSNAAVADSVFARLWRWFTTGNVLTRVGVVVLFFGVAFLLRYFAEHFDLPLQAKLIGVAIAGFVLMALGARLRTTRPGYGLSLEGGGAGVLYLTVFAAVRLYALLSPEVALALLVVVAAVTVWRAWRSDSQPLASLAVAGAFLAPMLVSARAQSPAPLFSYFAVVNAAILVLALGKAWRALNALGFVFTFVLGIVWGARFYTPEYLNVVEPFLILFFVFYVAIAVLYAWRESWVAHAPVDALLVFGVPLASFGLQTQLLAGTDRGAAWSAFAIAALYAILFLVLRRRTSAGLQALARAFVVLAIVFATLGIPFATDATWTSGWWALEAALAYWIGCRQRQPATRAFALLVELGAAVAYFVAEPVDPDARAFANATFIGALVIGVAGLLTARFADARADELGPRERTLSPLLLAWGATWVVGAGVAELWRVLPRAEQFNAMLGWVTAASVLALLLSRPLAWPRLAAVGGFLPPAMIIVGVNDLRIAHTTLEAAGWIVWPIAWVSFLVLLRRVTPADAIGPGDPRRTLPVAHVATAIGLVGQIAWESSEWVARYTPEGSVWIACAAALPAIAYLAGIARWRDVQLWPLSRYRESYTVHAGLAMSASLGVWFVAVNVMSPGDPAPLPYAPLANPLDLTLLASLGGTAYWMMRCSGAREQIVYRTLGAGLFVALNGAVLRAAYHWLDLPWQIPALLANRPLQAALTLTWSVTALPLMFFATRRRIRPLWMVGAALLAAVVVKLFAIDFAALAGLPRVVAFLGVGVLLLLIGYFAPLPPDRTPRTGD